MAGLGWGEGRGRREERVRPASPLQLGMGMLTHGRLCPVKSDGVVGGRSGV